MEQKLEQYIERLAERKSLALHLLRNSESFHKHDKKEGLQRMQEVSDIVGDSYRAVMNDSAYQMLMKTYKRYEEERNRIEHPGEDWALTRYFGNYDSVTHTVSAPTILANEQAARKLLNSAGINIGFPLKQLMRKFYDRTLTEAEYNGILNKSNPQFKGARDSLANLIKYPRTTKSKSA